MAMGVMPFFNPRAALQYTFDHTSVDGTDSATYTFASQAIGTAYSDRLVVVGYAFTNLTGQAITSVTIGGITATTIHSTGTNTACGLAWANVPTGTTASIVITPTSAGTVRCGISVYVVRGLQSMTAFATNASAGGSDASRNTSLNIAAGGVVFAVSASQAGATAWTNITEDADVDTEPANTAHISTAAKTSATAITPETPTSSNCRCTAAVSFR